MKKTKRKINKKKNKTQKAGIRILNGVSQNEAFKYFIENSTFTYYNRGFFGILILAKLKDGVQSPYRHIRTNSVSYVKHLLLKFFEIKTSTNEEIKNIDSTDIQREIDIQQAIYFSSLTNINTILEPICPCIVYSHSKILNKNYKESFHKIIKQSIQNNKQIDNIFQGDIAFFAMEFMEDYLPLSNYLNTYSGRDAINKSLYVLDKLHELGFMHNDFHDDNVLLNKNYNYFGFEKDINNGRAIIIDFGRTYQIKHPKIITEAYKLRLLQKESKYANPGLSFIFKNFDEEHKLVQDKCIRVFEKYYKCDIYKIINSYVFYKGGNMSILNSKLNPTTQYNYSKNDVKNKDNNKTKNEMKINNNLADKIEEEIKLINPEKYYELINSIKETLEEEKKYPGYVKALFSNQTNGLIDPAFVLPVDNDSTKLRLIMD